jgi:hypothetical protein
MSKHHAPPRPIKGIALPFLPLRSKSCPTHHLPVIILPSDGTPSRYQKRCYVSTRNLRSRKLVISSYLQTAIPQQLVPLLTLYNAPGSTVYTGS